MGLFNKKKVYTEYSNCTREEIIKLLKDSYQINEDNKRYHNRVVEDIQRDNAKTVADFESKKNREIADLKADHKIKMSEKEFELKHLADEKVLKAETAKTEMEKKLAVAESENKMLREIADLNGDIIDIKELVTKLIDKLPEIKLNSITVTENDKKSK